MPRNPFVPFLIVTVGVAALGTFALTRVLPDPTLLLPWFVAISVVTLLTFGYDKVVSGRDMTRVPEAVLLLLTLLGGTVGALVAMQLFRHKSAKKSFQVRFWGVVLVQVLAALGWWWWSGRPPASTG